MTSIVFYKDTLYADSKQVSSDRLANPIYAPKITVSADNTIAYAQTGETVTETDHQNILNVVKYLEGIECKTFNQILEPEILNKITNYLTLIAITRNKKISLRFRPTEVDYDIITTQEVIGTGGGYLLGLIKAKVPIDFIPVMLENLDPFSGGQIYSIKQDSLTEIK